MKHFNVRVLIVSLGLSICSAFLFAGAALGQSCEQWGGKIVSVQGVVQVQKASESKWMPVGLNATYCPGDMIRVLKNSRAAIVLSNETLFRLDQNTTVTFTGVEKEKTFLIEILKGVTHFFSRQPRRLKVVTPFLNAAVEGTEFYVRVAQDQTFITIFEGRVAASNKAGSLVLAGGQSAVAVAGKAPVLRVVVRPRDAVQWALYYPPIIDYKVAEYQPGPAAQTIQQALDSYWKGDLAGAFTALERVPRTHRDARYLNLRAGLLLTVGRVDEARSDIEQTLKLNPRNGTAFALRSIIEVVQNEKDQALKLANEAAQIDLQSPVPRVALSYAYQANFEIKKALESAKKAAELDPENSLAWARVSELELSAGELDRALKAARKAVDRNPDLARTQTVLGFAYLTQIKIKDAKKAFKKAIELDSSAPLPRLGLGLALIRKSDLKQGRGEIEIAASLDPNNALIRSYLGKAYFEEKQVKLAQTQFDIAKTLDSKDPTAWFYDAILKQSVNRPVDALQDLQRSIELNDNRAIYRSRLLLDKDLAARSVSLARIYDDLGFDQLAVNESTKSLDVDPSNYSAHRFLSDSYAERPRHETARVSELLQAQLLQPINLNPVQPEPAETNLNLFINASPSDASFNEFTPLFERNRVHLTATGVVGNKDTFADQAAASGVFNQFSYSLGQFHYETDGFRKNNDLEHDLYNVFAQASVSDKLDIQAEYRHRETDEGDLRLNFDPDDFSRIARRRINQDLPRVGFRFAPWPHSDLIFSFIYGDRNEKTSERGPQSRAGPTLQKMKQDDQGNDLQAQYVFRAEHLNVTTGFSIYDIDGTRRTRVILDDPSRELLLRAKEDLTGKWYEGYLYSDVTFPDYLLWTVGFSYVDFEGGQNGLVDFDSFNPKVGLQWSITDRIRLRVAAMKSIKRSLIFDQTIEPTQVSAFNQFFDDFNGTKAWRYGIGLDAELNENLYGGFELSRRDLEVPRTFRRFAFIEGKRPEATVTSAVEFEDQCEDLYRAYLYWTPSPDWAVTGQFRFERFERDPAESGNLIAEPNIPNDVKTITVPVAARYFASSGFFAGAGITYVWQKLDLAPGSTFNKDREDFFIVDTSIGYRLPRRWGIFSFDVNNLFDEDFLYQDVNIQTADPSEPRFVPERTFVARFTINF